MTTRPSPHGAAGRPCGPRDRDERHRASTPLEVLFDLCFVVAVAQAADHLHQALVQGQVADAVVSYGSVFFAIWWARMNFTWFASAYDTDDLAYRLLTLLQIGGVLLLAAGVPDGFDRQDFTVVTLGPGGQVTALNDPVSLPRPTRTRGLLRSPCARVWAAILKP
jgi:low temperature requirement protein LtrA